MLLDSQIREMKTEELNTLHRKIGIVLRHRNGEKRALKKASFKVGDKVIFRTRKGILVRGTVSKICRVNVQVMQKKSVGCDVKWTVSPNFLKKEEE